MKKIKKIIIEQVRIKEKELAFQFTNKYSGTLHSGGKNEVLSQYWFEKRGKKNGVNINAMLVLYNNKQLQ